MKLVNFRFDLDADGVVLLTWDMAERSMNLITEAVMGELDEVIDRVASDPGVKGCVITSGKATFSGGADLSMIRKLGADYAARAEADGREAAMQSFFEDSRRLSLLYRKLETCGKPWAAAINGLCLGGAFELALACHHRVLADHDAARVGLPEIKVGLFPGAGGSQRVARLMPTANALRMMVKGEQIRPAAAKAMGLVHALAPPDAVVAEAKAWITSGGKAVAPWDETSFKLPSGRVHSPAGMTIWPPANAIYRQETQDNYPAAKALLQSVYEGLQLPIDLALKVESRQFAAVLRSPEAAAMIRTLFVSTGELNKGARRPREIEPASLRRIGIIGAGFMGAGIAYASASAGLDVVLLDRTAEAAEAGKARGHALISAQIAKGRAKTADRDALLARIETGADYAALEGCDLVIEAVFEDPRVKADVLAAAESRLAPGAVWASNTSTLPITTLASRSHHPDRFVGIHFFSPVERMPLVEIIKGGQTGPRAIAVAMDFVRRLKKTPILVNDARGFYANRCVGAYLSEGHRMLMEGVRPALVENLGRQAGMPVGPLALSDEVALDLVRTVVTDLADGADAVVDPGQRFLLDRLVVDYGRLGRKNRKGFYDYPESGPKRLWPGLRDILPMVVRETVALSHTHDILKQRFLVAQALAAAEAVLQGIVTDPREADVGSILGFGFAPFTGGTLSYIDTMGVPQFVLLCDALSKRYGPRFAPSQALIDMAKSGTRFYAGATG